MRFWIVEKQNENRHFAPCAMCIFTLYASFSTSHLVHLSCAQRQATEPKDAIVTLSL